MSEKFGIEVFGKKVRVTRAEVVIAVKSLIGMFGVSVEEAFADDAKDHEGCEHGIPREDCDVCSDSTLPNE